MSACDTCLVRNRAICSSLDGEEIKALNAIGRRRNLTPGESLMWEGEDSVLVANVIEGVLKLSTGTEDGREQIVGVVYPSDFIGRPFGSTSGHGVTALTDARVCVFSRKDFDAFAREHPALENKLLQRTLAELDRTRRWMLLLGRKSAGEKVASFLLEMSERLVLKHPDNATYLDTYAWVLYIRKDYKKAKQFLEKAVQAKEGVSGTIVEHYGDVLFQLGEREKAVEQWKKAKTMGQTSDLLEKKIATGTLHEQ